MPLSRERRPPVKTLVAAALGECVHVAGVMRFLRLAESAGWKTVFLGPAVPVEQVLAAARQHQADMVAVSYRLTPENGAALLGEFAEEADDLRAAGVRFAFGGTPPVADRAREIGFFERVFDGSDPIEDTLAYLKGDSRTMATAQTPPQQVIERLHWKAPYPLIRHHFGLPTVENTRAGIARIAEAKVIDVISLGTDQDAQANFYHPERQDMRRTGAGGVPVRSPEDYRLLYDASRTGNYPLLRTYAGSDDLLQLAEMYVATMHNAWCAVPVFWFNRMDGRGPHDLPTSITEHQRLMAWHGRRGIPVEVNEPHHWGMRDAPDVVYVVSAYLSAYLARAAGVQDYIAQFMFNCPADISEAMDLAKMLAILDLIAPLTSDTFRVWRQTRTGLLSYPLDDDAARAHLSASIYMQMLLRPHIVHVVGHTEAHHAATADEVISACKMARRAIENALSGQPDLTADTTIAQRRVELAQEAMHTLKAIKQLAPPGAEDPLTDPATLARAVMSGILDAPHLLNNPYARGAVTTRIDQRGACVAIDAKTGQPLSEAERLSVLDTGETSSPTTSA
ncbi:MAG: cobalamin-dependent protein [Anaerolineae bacterium]